MGLLDGKVVLVTGAGGGIGRSHALACAAEGAAVIVNDLGGTRDGTGTSPMADKVVAEIVAAGGRAVADYGSVTDFADCEAMVATAREAFGGLHVIVNNAGILRDKTFAKMTDAEWFPVIDVHLNGSRNVTRAALTALKESGGAIINTTSLSGMIGNFGQSNYAAAKAAIYGLTRVLALELRKFGVTANAIAPVAKTRMTDDIAMVEDDWTPDQISPIVVFLASDLGKNVTGSIFGVQGQRLHVYEVKVNDGVTKDTTDLWTPQEISEQLAQITAFEAPAPATDGDSLTEAFSFFPEGFKPGAVPGWNAVIQWQVSGGADQTITIGGDTCTVAEGLVGNPTCTVKVDHGTVLGMMTGEIDPQKAFMSGKASADNMGDLMKLAMAFDFSKAAAAYEASRGSADTDLVSAVFDHFPAGFKPAAASGWNAVIHWQVNGGTDQTISVAEGNVTVAHELTGSPTCTVKVAKDDLVAMMTGQLDPQKAFMGGKANADNMGDLMKMAMAFDFDAIGKSYEGATGGAAPAAAPEAPPTVAVEDLVGMRFDGGYYQIDRNEYAEYARATDDDNPAYFSGDGVAPPMIHVKAFVPLLTKMATHPALNLDLLRLVHGEHDVRFKRPLRHGDILETRGTLRSVEHKSSGMVVTFDIFGFVEGQTAIEGTTAVFIRGKKRSDKAKPALTPAPAPPSPEISVIQKVSLDQASRYAAASGDNNPIHIDPNTAKAAGLPGVILHGLCTMAFAQRDLVNELAGGDPTRLKRLGVRFAKPVFPGGDLTLNVWRADTGVQFETHNADGQTVISNGVAEIA